MTRLQAELDLSRKVIEHGRRYYHVVNVRRVDEIDEQLLEWLTEAWETDL